MQHNRQQRHSFKMTVGGGDEEEGEFDGADVPPARPIRTTSYLSSGGGGVGGNIRCPQQALRQTGGTNQLGNKDLIIRMLAEIFQVRHDEHTGQVRWRQVSTSLVPISLYSRTTSKWLDYLLEAAQGGACSTGPAAAAAMHQVNDPAAQTMSPDSRDFLLQLQQFHQRQQQLTRPTSRGANNLDPRRAHLLAHNQAQQDSIVFQVVGHDFLDGQCRKILNVKIRQPGVRLGQASDYFVYWKELAPGQQSRNYSNHHHHLYHQQLSASSFADSSVQSACTPTLQMLNPTGGGAPGRPGQREMTAAQTWGLNFASINDAKLFYDICSLNLVNLDFNSDYLRQLTSVSDTRGAHNRAAHPLGANSYQPNPNMLNSHRVSSTRVAKQPSWGAPARQASHASTRQGGMAAGQSRCPSCMQAFEMMANGRKQQQQQQRQVPSSASNPRIDALGSDAMLAQCPVHGNKPVANSGAGGIRVRSRSTTRQPLAPAEDKENNGPISVRARSFSTPASPEPNAEACPVHRKRRQRAHTESEDQRRSLKLSKSSLDQPARPEKPARGLLRSFNSNSQEKFNGDKNGRARAGPPPVPQHSQDLRALHTKRNTKTRYMGYLHNALAGQQLEQRAQFDDPAARREQQPPPQHDNRSLFQAAETFDAISRDDARLARARYANSRNMKEFLSLDAGGQLPAAAAAPSLQRFHTMRSQRAAAQSELVGLGGERRATKNVAQSKSIDKSGGPARPERRLPAQPAAAASSDTNPLLSSNLSGAQGQCSVSTTTEDLPMDTTTKRRMLKLTSEEVISEATEPRSAATSMSTVVERGAMAAAREPAALANVSRPQAGADQRQVRAISLGPPATNVRGARGGGGGGGSAARSDAGRRRSLERSTRIDQDPASSFVKFSASRLSPLPQSNAASPLVPPPTSGPQQVTRGCLANSPARREWSPESANYKLGADEDGRHQQQQQQCSRPPVRAAEAATRPTASPRRAQLDYAEQHVRLFARTLHDASAAVTNQAQMASHKSAPDIGRLLVASERVGERDDFYDAGRPDTHGHLVNISHRRLPTGGPNVNSYAVPLCTTVKRRPLAPGSAADVDGGRQCRSCPNSLRRKRRAPAAAVEPPPVDSGQYCSCHHGPRISPAGLAQVCRNDSECFACHPGPLHVRQTTCCQYQHHHHHHHHQLCPADHTTRHPCAGEGGGGHDGRLIAAASYHKQMSAPRPHSSQSVRSPTQYGLYESEDSAGDECEEEDEQEDEEEEEERLSARPVEFGDSLQLQDYHEQRGLDSARAYHSRPATLRPVPGYDRTLARASLKATRQRSKSQPPGGESADETRAASAFHLTKSMENVEKLIREVQSELRALKRQPLLGTAKIDLKQQPQASCEINPTKGDEPLVQTCKRPATSTTATTLEVSREEQERAAAGHETPEDANQRAQVSFTSATRRAGQFKCVGAIRKAGFLSVKKWILKRRQSIELARKQGWKRYWVCLRGTALLFHSVIEEEEEGEDQRPARMQERDNNESSRNHRAENSQTGQTDLLTWIQTNCSGQLSILTNLLESENVGVSRETFFNNMSRCFIEKEPRHLIIIDGAIAQPIPEHPRRDFVFCLSTTFGDAYLFQASCQLESDNWTSAIHNACAASIARDLVRDEAIKLFETKIKHFELEAEKKLFLRQRLESRLTSMSSMCQQRAPASGVPPTGDAIDAASSQAEKSKTTMRSLLCQLSQQLLALDTYIEQLHCEVYQLRCYLSSCGAQNIFYQQAKASQPPDYQVPIGSIQNDLPNPKSLLMHVSKPTKLLLIKLGVFTVSSFHAYIHARQESAQSILLQTIRQQQQQQQEGTQSPLVELRIRSRSISETLVARSENVKLADETENLIELANLKTVLVLVGKSVLENIGSSKQVVGTSGAATPTPTPASDDRYTIESRGDTGDQLVSVKMNSSSTSSSIIKQVLKIVAPHAAGESQFLNYFLRLVVESEGRHEPARENNLFVAVKREETLEDWSNYAHLELLEKIIFRLELTRSRVDEEESSAPFGVSVEGQLVQGDQESLLNVYCSYIEWGSAADKAGLQDEDEFLALNGVPLGDLDLMFVECIIQEASKLKLVVRSNRCEWPAKARRLNRNTWRSLDDNDDDGDPEHREDPDRRDRFLPAPAEPPIVTGVAGSQLISDEYLTSLVCPPPPARSSAFLRTDTNLLRQKSDLSMDKLEHESSPAMSKSKSQHRIDSLDLEGQEPAKDRQVAAAAAAAAAAASARLTKPVSSADLARQLLQRSERLTKLLTGSREPTTSGLGDNLDKLLSSAHSSISGSADASAVTQNRLERLRKSILELIETEYAYIRHLETISEHYMSPLGESSFLGIQDLRDFNATVLAVLRFQHAFFGRLMDCIFEHCRLDFAHGVHKSVARDHFERFNKIVQHTESIGNLGGLAPMLGCIAKTFAAEADKFRVYAGYCAAYSRLQRILHPRSASASASKGPHASTITSAPTSLNSFQSSSLGLAHIGELAGGQQSSGRGRQADFKLLAFDNGNLKLSAGVLSPAEAQLRKLADFLGSLDSSSSSASFSLPRSSSPSEQRANEPPPPMIKPGGNSADLADPTPTNTSQSYQKSVHQQNFESYLIKPIQRIVKYPMLLNSIALAASALAGQPNDDLLVAIKQMETVINHVNDAQRAHDEYGPILAHIQRQFIDQLAFDLHQRKGSHRGIYASSLLFGHHQPPISLSLAQLLYFGPVDWLNLGEFTSRAKKFTGGGDQLQCALFVFESCVVFLCKELVVGKASRRMLTSGEPASAIVRYQTLIPVSEVQVRSVPSSSAADEAPARHKWELFQCSSSNSNSSFLTSAAAAATTTTTTTTTKKSAASAKREQKQNQQKVYLLSSQTNEQRSAFLRKIRLTIRDSVRNMSLPPQATGNKSPTTSQNRSPPSTTTCSKKLSTSSASSVTSNGGGGEEVTHNSTATSLSPPESSGAVPGAEHVVANGSGQQQQASATTGNNKCPAYPPTSIEVNT